MEFFPININGYDTYYVDNQESAKPSLLIAVPNNAGKDISEICGSIICGHWIKQVDYEIIDEKRFIKAYY